MDKKPSNDQEVSVKCPICHGTGFGKPGEICPCITGEGLDALGFLRDVFKMEPKPN